MTFRYLFEHRFRQGIREAEGNEVKSRILLPVGKAPAFPDAHINEPRLNCTLNDRSGWTAGCGISIGHEREFYAERMCAGGDARTTGGWP